MPSLPILTFVVIWAAAIGGWIINVVTLIQALPGNLSQLLDIMTTFNLIQVAGVFIPPLGSIIGWISLFV